MKTTKLALLIICILMVAVLLDFKSNNYDLIVKNIEIPAGNGSTECMKTISVPVVAQLYNVLANFMYGLAVAIFITFFIVSKIEARQKETHEKELNELRKAVNVNVFDALFKTVIPKEIFDIVKSELIENKVIRKKARWNFIFEKNESGGFTLTSINNYQLLNISKDMVVNPVTMNLTPTSGGDFIFNKARCVSRSGNEVLVEYDKNDKSKTKNVEIDECEDGSTIIRYSVKVPPDDIVEFTSEFTSIYHADVFDVQYTKHPIIDLDINVTFPAGTTFNILPLLSNDLKIISEGTTYKSYKLEGGVLPRQGIFYQLTSPGKEV